MFQSLKHGVTVMFEKQSKRVTSSVQSSGDGSNLNVGADLAGDPVYLSGQVIPSQAFSQAMLALGKVVRMPIPVKPDHSAYQKWVTAKYYEELESSDKQSQIMARSRELTTQLRPLVIQRDQILDTYRALSLKLGEPRRQFWEWLSTHNRDAWIVLDPIVSVQGDGTFFEAFSMDESVYARVFLPHSALDAAHEPSLGTTNIDFGTLLEREFARVRSYRPLNLSVGLNSVDIATTASSVVEERIPLPESWVRGLVEVQSVLSLAPVEFDLSSDGLAEVIARLESEVEKVGPRSLKFTLDPNKPIRIEIEPWGEIFNDDSFVYHGKVQEIVRVWGRRRLSVLKDLLVKTDRVRVRLIGSGMPSFWTITRDGIETTIGLSGWTSNDWASKAKFSALLPASEITPEQLVQGIDHLRTLGTIDSKSLAKRMELKAGDAAALLQRLCITGKAMYDPERKLYRWRDLFPTLEMNTETEASLEERKGIELFKGKKLKVIDDQVKDAVRYLEGSIDSFRPILELDADARPRHAQCSCPFFKYNKLRQGPCRHMVALSLQGGQ